MNSNYNFINHEKVLEYLEEGKKQRGLDEIIAKAKLGKGLSIQETATLLWCEDKETLARIFETAEEVKKDIYGNRIVIFAPLYLSNYCINHCTYCGYHSGSDIVRRKLTQEEIALEVQALEAMGHKRLAIETGEDPKENPLEYVLESLATIYKVRNEHGNIRRVNVNIAATTVEDYRKLKDAGIGTYILFQETYHKDSYKRYHPAGPKSDYEYHLTAFHRAMEAGIDDVGSGILFGLYDFRYELIALLMHAAQLEADFGVGPHTVSVPRLRPAQGVDLKKYPYLVSDADFAKIIALVRLAMPYTGIILSTRESAEARRRLLKLGVSQISAGSCTGVGGYRELPDDEKEENTKQFQVDDSRKPNEIYRELCTDGFLPSFCTACYRQGRTGDRFMALAKTGEIGKICGPNALLTFQEYLEDYAEPETRVFGEKQIKKNLAMIGSDGFRGEVQKKLDRIKHGERDLYY
ncbi:MAG: [FeFe] hydrogenase H-cluster radical SAM maturase HydG [Spirochaetota bacterium]